MKKTIPTSIAHTLFYIEEDGYKKLDEYLISIRAHFAQHSDSAEIIRDIEARIAEQFVEYSGGTNVSGNRIITLIDVEKIISTMGTPKDFDESDDSGKKDTPHEKSHKKGYSTRKLYRDPDNTYIGGVAAGIAAYLGIDPIIVRAIFLVSFFFGGTGIVLYIILWIVIPEAVTASQKLEMRGEPVTLETVSETIKEKIDEVKSRKDTGKKILSVPFEIIRRVAQFIGKSILPFIGKIAGIFVHIFTAIIMVAFTSALIVSLFNPTYLNVNFPLREIISGPFYYLIVFVAFTILTIPISFLSALGNLLMGRRPAMTKSIAGILLITWLAAIVVAIVSGFSLQGKYVDAMANDPRFQEITRTIEPAIFNAIHAENGQAITFKQGNQYSVQIHGREQDIERLIVETKEGTLHINRTKDGRICFFCFSKRVTMEITAPTIKDIAIENGVQLTVPEFTGNELSLHSSNGGWIQYNGKTTLLTLNAENGSWITLNGTTDRFSATLQNGVNLKAGDLHAKRADLKVSNGARAEVNVEEELTGSLRNGADLEQYGKASPDNLNRDKSSDASVEVIEQ